ncbi:CCA tRNA nucleotidyltransferase 1, mitochondrial-like isoform X2 [Dendronephthya gigantea]|nr:CCA tRNA nucleotidyltransferase 1, mitochondrial-like isoform X2 [Dendronephthya gigantea]
MSTAKENIVKKVQSPLLKDVLTPELLTVTNAFQENGYEIRLVGGVVRDLLLEVQSKDIDLSTNATPEQMKDVFVRNGIRFIETGLEHGTLTAHLDHFDFEVTTLRYDTEQDGRWAKVVFTNDWRLDAERRDLTINAMSMDTNCCLYDYFGGVEDLRCRRVRFVGDAGQRIREDFLRILRYFRFYGRIATDADKHDSETLEVIREMAFGLEKIAVERIWMEMSKILIGNFAPSIMKHIYNLGVAKCIGLPEICSGKLEEFEAVWCRMKNHTPQAVTLLVSLVDDIESTEVLAKKLKLSNAEKLLGKFIATHRHLNDHPDFPLKPYQDILVSCPAKCAEQLRRQVIELLYYEGKSDLAKDIETWQIAEFPVNGNDLKQHNIKPGPNFGKILNRLKEMWKDSYYTLSRQELLEKIDGLL